ncbi:MAG TPA: PfkB family carbohydrate kinase [Nitrososphaeraceae archaeon]|jgi:sugar/nucleoside kinase (ribokinase family)|nr:PfkB family carbohydrate kinase [Nitrososphaeraceae archaeon]
MHLTVFGSLALDTTRTPFRTEVEIMGGAATYAAFSASKFVQTEILGVIGSDFPKKYLEILRSKVGTAGLALKFGKRTFRYDSSFNYDLSHRTTNKTDLNVIAEYEPAVPDQLKDSQYIYLANNDPIQNMKMLKQFMNPKLVVCDTIEFWIQTKPDAVKKMFGMVHGVIINDQEAKMLCGVSNLIKCAKEMLSWGPEFVIIKKGEHGSVLVRPDMIFVAPAYPLEEVVDPTGAGDSFAGGFMGYLASIEANDVKDFKSAVVYGNVMGSFAVEDFGLTRLISIGNEEIVKRFHLYRALTQL